MRRHPPSPAPPTAGRLHAAVPLAVALLLTACSGGPGGAGSEAAADFSPVALHLTMDEDALDDLYSREVFDDERLDGTIAHGADGEEQPVELRFRGSSSRLAPKKSFNVRFEEEQPFLFGSKRMNLNASWTDPTLMREALAMAMWRELGHPAPRTAFVDLHINGVYEGLYVHVERIDDDLLEHAGLDPDGTLVRDEMRVDASMPTSAFGLDPADVDDGDRLAGLLEEHGGSRGDPEWDELADLVAAVVTTEPGPAFGRLIAERFDEDALLDWLALHVLTGDIDGFADDYWLYLDHEDPDARWIPIPWDKDLTFGSHSRPERGTTNHYFSYDHDLEEAARFWQNGLVQKVFDTPVLARRLRHRTLALTETTFTPEWFRRIVGAMAEDIRPSLDAAPGPNRFVRHPGNHHGGRGRTDEHVEALHDYVELRWAHLDRLWGGGGGRRPAPGTATVEVTPDHVGSRVVLTDPTGMVLAGVDVASVSGEGTLTVTVAPTDEPFGVDHTWRFTGDGVAVRGTVDLYYRNDGGYGDGVEVENWYRDDAAVAGQRRLTATVLDDGARSPLPTRVNPFSDKATAQDVRLRRGTTEIALR